MVPEPTVFIVDDDHALRESLEWLVETVGLSAKSFDSPPSFLEAYEADTPGCLVIDVRLRGMSGLDLQDKLEQLGINLPVIMMSGFGDVSTAVRAMKGGAIDFLEKPFSNQTMLELIQRCLRLDAQARRLRLVNDGLRARVDTLTPREREVMSLVVSGRSNKEISSELGISPKTVEAHRAMVMRKMQAQSLADLVRMADLADVPLA